MAFISRDPFARQEIHREVVPGPHPKGCSWCGQTRRNGSLFQYRTESDDNPRRPGAHRGLYCSKSCHDDDHRSWR